MTAEYDRTLKQLAAARKELKRLDDISTMRANLMLIYRNDPHRLAHELEQLRMAYE